MRVLAQNWFKVARHEDSYTISLNLVRQHEIGSCWVLKFCTAFWPFCMTLSQSVDWQEHFYISLLSTFFFSCIVAIPCWQILSSQHQHPAFIVLEHLILDYLSLATVMHSSYDMASEHLPQKAWAAYSLLIIELSKILKKKFLVECQSHCEWHATLTPQKKKKAVWNLNSFRSVEDAKKKKMSMLKPHIGLSQTQFYLESLSLKGWVCCITWNWMYNNHIGIWQSICIIKCWFWGYVMYVIKHMLCNIQSWQENTICNITCFTYNDL